MLLSKMRRWIRATYDERDWSYKRCGILAELQYQPDAPTTYLSQATIVDLFQYCNEKIEECPGTAYIVMDMCPVNDFPAQHTIVFKRYHPHLRYAAIWDPRGHLTKLEAAECITNNDDPKDKKWKLDTCTFWLIWCHLIWRAH